MTDNMKSSSAYKTIGEVAKELNLINNKNGTLQTHTLRFWEKQFRQIKPAIRAGKRRYYSKKDFETIRLVKYLLKDQGMTIKGVKKVLANKKNIDLDDSISLGLNATSLKDSKLIKNKISKISKIIKELKDINNG